MLLPIFVMDPDSVSPGEIVVFNCREEFIGGGAAKQIAVPIPGPIDGSACHEPPGHEEYEEQSGSADQQKALALVAAASNFGASSRVIRILPCHRITAFRATFLSLSRRQPSRSLFRHQNMPWCSPRWAQPVGESGGFRRFPVSRGCRRFCFSLPAVPVLVR